MMRLWNSSVPKQLTLSEMNQLYILIGQHARSESGLLVDEVEKMLDGMSDEQFSGALEIMYGKRLTYKTPVDALVSFIRGVKAVKLFGFIEFMESLQ